MTGRLALLAGAHGLTRARAAWVVAAWLLAIALCRVGVPPIDPTVLPVPRPLEMVGTLAVCLPTSLHASLLRDRSSWLTGVAARPVRHVRLPWLAVTTLAAAAGSGVWLATLSPAVPRAHAAGVCALAYGLALCSVRLLASDLATVLPALVLGAATWVPALPFDHNIVYNVQLTASLWWAALAAATVGGVAVARRGTREPIG